MDKKYLLTMAAAAAMFAACSDDAKESLAGLPEVAKNPTEVNADKIPVSFGAYVNRATTRAGVAGDLAVGTWSGSESRWDGVAGSGFGVFGYYTDNKDYDQLASPNFFYNERVYRESSEGGEWKYNIIRYWPNEYGSSAVSDDADRVTFFAYAPYVEVEPASGKVKKTDDDDDTWGITGMSRNTVSGDPIIKYVASFDQNKAVDLLWGVCDQTDWTNVQTGKAQSFTTGKPWLDVQRPAQTDQKLKFSFRHALAKLAINVDEFKDNETVNGSVANETRIWIRSVRFKGFTMRGALNLNNETVNQPYWMNYNGIGDLESDGEVIVYDGRKDGKEGTLGAVATNEKTLGLNPKFIENEKQYGDKAWATHNESSDPHDGIYGGVDATKTPLFANGGIFYVIPADDNLEVEVTYDVETIDSKLGTLLSDGKTPGSHIENTISKTISFGGNNTKLESGKAYQINLHIGMNSVKFDAAVKEWETMTPADVDVPANVAFFTAAANGTGEVDLPYNVTSYIFGINGLEGGESVTPTVGKNITSENGLAEAESSSEGALTNWNDNDAKKNANSSGYAIQTLNTAANPTTTDRIQKWTWTGNQSNNKLEMTFIQKAHPLFMKITDGAKEQKTIILTRSAYQAASSDWTNAYGWICDGYGKEITPSDEDGNDFGVPADNKDKNYIKVWRNGARLTWVAEINELTAPLSVFTFKNKSDATGEGANSTNTITIGDKLEAGDVIKVTIKTGDAPEETVTWTVPE
ncbi:MAG: fimbrillin family protein [Bacteroidaceae bacterium]|nr:fimbrillin family protein [Bacteroidaceae bacterium]